MSWTVPEFSKSLVDRTGHAFRHGLETGLDFDIIYNWRSAHNYPLTSIQRILSRRAKNVDSQCVTAKRIKRLISITDKLKGNTMRLSGMQDIGGCRAILSDVDKVFKLCENYKKSGGTHILFEENDYISRPQKTGYRGIHLIYKYAGKKKEYHGLKIEIQIRSAKQHAWATAVESIGFFTKNALKSNKGNAEWLRFFALMGSAIADLEKCQFVPGTPDKRKALKAELLKLSVDLNVVIQLNAYSHALKQLPIHIQQDDYYFLLVFDIYTTELEVRGYLSSEFQKASQEYSEIERSIGGGDKNAVLVSVENYNELRTAYPNYFLDTTVFRELVYQAIS